MSQESKAIEQAEIWKDIPGYEGYYQASTLGRIRSVTRTIQTPRYGYRTYEGRVLSFTFGKFNGYLMVGLRKDCKQKVDNVHKFIAITFLGPRPVSLVVNHIDGNKVNNRLDNLEYVTPSENSKHALRIGLRINKWTRQCALTGEQVRELRKRHVEGLSMSKLAKEYGITKGSIQNIIERKSYRWVE